MFQSPTQLKKRRKALVKKYYEPKIEAAAVGGTIGATLSGMGATSIKKLSKFKVPAAIIGGTFGAMIGADQSKKSIVRELRYIDRTLGETKASNIKKLGY